MEKELLREVWPDWEIVGEIGRGSYGVVYEAVHREYGIESRAAVKVITIPQNEIEVDQLRAEGYSLQETSSLYQCFIGEYLNEIHLMESFGDNQHIVNLQDFKVVRKEKGLGWTIYIRMELLTPLYRYLGEKAVTEADVLRLGCDICTALEQCSEKNVIHRDIKPQNILVNGAGDYKLGDFGISRSMMPASGLLTTKKGTPYYMAPEVALGASYDQRADICSLGLVLYWMAHGRRIPFLDPKQRTKDYQQWDEAVHRRLQGEPLPPPNEASPALAQIILCACAHDPDDRFSTAADMKQALLALQEGTYQYERDVLRKTVNGSAPPPRAETPVPTKTGFLSTGRGRRIAIGAAAGGLVLVLLLLWGLTAGRTESGSGITGAGLQESGEVIPSWMDHYQPEKEEVLTDNGLLHYGGHTYGIIDLKETGLVNLDTAELMCEKIGGHMLLINDEAENMAVYHYILDEGYHSVFFGYTDRREEGQWEWVWGDSDYTNWEPGQPNNGANNPDHETENFAQFYKQQDENDNWIETNGTWNDAPYSSNTYFLVCEWEKEID